MIKDVVIKNLNKNVDERGWLAEIYRNDELNYQPVMGYVSATKNGVIRGPHEHKFQSDCFVFWDQEALSCIFGTTEKIVKPRENI